MNSAGRFLFALLFTFGAAIAQTSAIEAQTRLFLDAYARGDRDAVLKVVDPDATVYGSDSAEVFHGRAALAAMIANDKRLWGGTAHIGAMEHISVIQSGRFAAIFFDAPFSVGGRPAVPVRFALVWRRDRKTWLLVQSSNVVPTQHQSAAELLDRMSVPK